jgi:hypothetical protein
MCLFAALGLADEIPTYATQGSATFEAPSDLIQFGVRFDSAELESTCTPVGSVCQDWLCGTGGAFSPRTEFLWPYLTLDTDTRGTDCDTQAPDYLDAVSLDCTDDTTANAPAYTITCDVCDPDTDLTTLVAVYGPFWLDSNSTVLTTADCAFGWAFFVDTDASILSKELVCGAYGDATFAAVFTITTAFNATANVTSAVIFNSTVLPADFFGTDCAVLPTSTPTPTDATPTGVNSAEGLALTYTWVAGGLAGSVVLMAMVALLMRGNCPLFGKVALVGGGRGEYVAMKVM